MTARVFAIGLDGAEPSLLESWIEEGKLPNLAALQARGTYSRLRSIPGFSDAAWASFYTGCGPATHGYYHFRQVMPGTVRLVLANRRAYRRPFWWLLRKNDDSQRPITLLDVPKAPMMEDSGGIQITGWGEHYAYDVRSIPPGVYAEIERRFGAHPHHGEIFPTRGRAHEREILRNIITGANLRAEVTRFVMEKAHWDLFMTAFSETHSAGHQFWHHTDPASPAYDPDISPEMSGAIRDAYIAVDAALGRILEELPPDVDVFAFSLHGLETHPAGRSFLKPLMERLGYQIPPTARSKRDPLQILRDLIPGWARDLANRFLLPRSAQDAAVERLFATGCDWSRTRAVAEDSREGFPWVRINLQGREPEGIVAPGAEYEALCDEIAAEIQKLRVHPGGERAVREVWRTRQHFEGPHLDELPDLIVFWEKGTPIHAVVHPEAGIIEGDQPVLQTAQHRPESFFIAAGPHIRAGASSSSPAIIDLAPTMLHMLGSAIPEDMEGRVLTEILEHSGQPRCAKFNWKVNPWT